METNELQELFDKEMSFLATDSAIKNFMESETWVLSEYPPELLSDRTFMTMLNNEYELSLQRHQVETLYEAEISDFDSTDYGTWQEQQWGIEKQPEPPERYEQINKRHNQRLSAMDSEKEALIQLGDFYAEKRQDYIEAFKQKNPPHKELPISLPASIPDSPKLLKEQIQLSMAELKAQNHAYNEKVSQWSNLKGEQLDLIAEIDNLSDRAVWGVESGIKGITAYAGSKLQAQIHELRFTHTSR